MNAEELVQNIINYCKSNRNDDLVKKYSRYFKNGYIAYGLSSDQMHAKSEAIVNSAYFTKESAFQISRLLIKYNEYELPTFACLFFKHFDKDFDISFFNEVSNWFDKGINNWAHCDIISGDIIGVMLTENIINIQDLSDWIYHPNKFKRRSAAVSLIKLAKKKNVCAEVFDFIDDMMLDKEREVHQGLGWLIREIWKIYPEPAEEFLLKWKNSAARLIFQYACEKMTKENKLKFKKEKQ